MSRFLLVAILLALLLAGCTAGLENPLPIQFIQTRTPTPFQPLPPTGVPTEPIPPTPTPVDVSGVFLWVDPQLPPDLLGRLRLSSQISLVGKREDAILFLESGGEHPVSDWVYALVAPFPTVEDGISSANLETFWREGSGGLFGGSPLLVDDSTGSVFSALWGEPAAGAVEVLEADQIVDAAWQDRPSWALVPFENLSPRWKVLEVDGQSPLRKEFNRKAYLLTVPVSLNGDRALVEAFLAAQSAGVFEPLTPASNRDPDRLTTLAMTGVTALVRATAFTMENSGILYPAQDIGGWLSEADITHISNEVPFAIDCPFPNPVQVGVVFCSDSRYIELLEAVGTDIVELTGDHFADWGSDAMLYTLDLYNERGWQYYGGGANLEEGKQPITIEHNGNRLAFIGCNGKGGAYASATAGSPGSVYCDFPFMHAEIERLREEGYLPIATFQHFEYYTYAAMPPQERDFPGMAEAGAVIVSGSQAHHPQAFIFNGDSLIHYGLGNLFFDQYDVSLGARQGFIDRHVFYDGRYIGTDLLTIMFVDYARPRPMTPSEREQLLRAVFSASGW